MARRLSMTLRSRAMGSNLMKIAPSTAPSTLPRPPMITINSSRNERSSSNAVMSTEVRNTKP